MMPWTKIILKRARFLQQTLAAAALLAIGGLACPARAAPALWQVSNGSTTIYLFGSVHALPAHFTWIDARISAALAESTEIWTATDPVWHESDRQAIRRYGMDRKRNLMQDLPEEYRAHLADEMRLAGVAPSVYAHVRPWLADVLLTRGALREAGLGVHTGVEATLYYYAQTHRIPTFSFESIDDQLAIYNDLPDADQLIALEDQIDAFETAGNSLGSLVHAWYTGDDHALDQLTNQRLQQSSPRTWTDIVLRRNGDYAKKIAERMQDPGVVFVALGAAHLCGSVSVQALLRNYGLTTTRVSDDGAGEAAPVKVKKKRHHS